MPLNQAGFDNSYILQGPVTVWAGTGRRSGNFVNDLQTPDRLSENGIVLIQLGRASGSFIYGTDSRIQLPAIQPESFYGIQCAIGENLTLNNIELAA